MSAAVEIPGRAAVGVLGAILAFAAANPVTAAPAAPSAADAPQATAPSSSTIDARPWPRSYQADGVVFDLFRPQLEEWSGDRLTARMPMAVKVGESKDSNGQTVARRQYGVVWFTARTETDKEAREVVLDDIIVTKVSFPDAKADEAKYLAVVKKVAPTTSQVASLDQLEAAVALGAAERKDASAPVDNTPPAILFAFEPAVLVPVQGEPVWRPTGIAGVDRVANTRALLLRYQNKYYLGYANHWGVATSLDGPWAAETAPPAPLTQAMQKAASTRETVTAAAETSPALDLLRSGGFPDIHVRTRPTELIQFDGEPTFMPIEGTTLSYVTNTPADVFIDASRDNAWYLLISGRWFTAASTNGPWTYVAPNALPADFAKIPSDGPKGAVLASISGTPEAREAVIANDIPQTAAVSMSQARFAAQFDGAPQLKAIEGTSLAYVRNSPTPIIRVSETSYYALDKGVWFTASTLNGPWTVATSVPPAIYGIPPSSQLHYVTYVRVYETKGDTVYVGYTPGYYGTVVANNVVVYGTGFGCDPWVGAYWYDCPWTYGYGAAMAWGAAGWAWGYGWGYDPWYDPYWGPWYGYGYGYPAAAANVYGRWGNAVVGGTAAAWANPWTGNYGRGGAGGFYNQATGGRGYGYAGSNFNAYTGRMTNAAGGVRYNPQTGRVVAGQGASVGNIYTGAGAAGGSRTVVNTNTGRTTNTAAGASRSAAGASIGRAFNTTGQAGDARGAGYVHYDRASGDISRGGVADINDQIYAGRDGNVYKRQDGGGWEKVGGDGQFRSSPLGDRSLERDSLARDRGMERDAFAGRREPAARASSFDRGSFGGGFSGHMGGMRMGGGMRGGFRR